MINLIILSLNLFSVIAIYFGLQIGWMSIFIVTLFFTWFVSLSVFSNVILSKIFPLPNLYIKLLGVFFNIFFLGFIVNIFTSWFIFNNFTLSLALGITSLILFCWSYFFNNIEPGHKIYLGNNDGLWKISNLVFIVFALLVILGLAIVVSYKTGSYLTSPWQILPLEYLVVVFLLLIIVFSLVFSKQKVWLIMVAIIATSFLMHTYLLTYSEGFGGDRWRHIGSENRILAGIDYQPTLLSDNIWYQNIFGLNIPRALIAGPKISYGFQWSLVSIVSKVFKIDIFSLDKYFIIVLWSLFLPLISFSLAFQFKNKRKFGLLVSALTLVFYLLQYYGSQTLPISFSALYFLFLVSCYLSYFKSREKLVLAFIVFLTALSYFGYSLSFAMLLIAFLWLLAFNLSPIKKYLVFFILSFTIFLGEVLSGFSTFKRNFHIGEILREVFIKGNFLFFDKGSFLPLEIKYWYILSLMVSLIFVFICCYVGFKILRERIKTNVYLISLIFIFFINYLSSWLFLDGLHSLARRMSIFIVLLLIYVLAYWVYIFSNNRLYAVLIIVAMSFIGILTYASGPVLEAAVTEYDTASMKYIWDQIGNDQPSNYCVLANTWSLLALESYSAKEVVAGNFPSDFNYNQDQRVDILKRFIGNPSLSLIDEALDITRTKSCFIVIDYNSLNNSKLNYISNLLGKPNIFGQNLVWQYR